jgi:hypothetical protein
MKKLYMLAAAMLVVSFSFAQIQPQVFRQQAKPAAKPEFKHNATTDAKNGAAAEWLDYPGTIYGYWAEEPTIDDIAIGRVAVDSNGLTYYSDGDTGYGFWFGWGQTYDLNNGIWDEVMGEGNLSLNGTTSYNIDSVVIVGSYLRGASAPANGVDTLIVAVNTTLNEDAMTSLQSGGISCVQYFNVPYDQTTHMTTGATIFKLPLTAADCSDTSETGGIYAAEYVLPIGLTNVTNKYINVTYSFKRDYTVPLNDNIEDHSRFYGWVYKDFRTEYYPFATGSAVTPPDEILFNYNQGTIISEYNVNHNGLDFFRDYLYPAPIWNASCHYPYLLTKVSCNDCAIVNVPELEKTNPTVYPNPATNNFTVNLGNDEKANIQLFNIVGQQVYSETITGSAQVNVANLNSGVYMLKVSQNGSVYTTKVVVK